MCSVSSVSLFCLVIVSRLLELKETWFTHPVFEFYRKDKARFCHTGSGRSGEHSSGTLSIAVVGLISPAFLGLSIWHMSTGRLQGHIQKESTASSSVGGCQVGEASHPHRHICDSCRELQVFSESRPHCLPLGVTFSITTY